MKGNSSFIFAILLTFVVANCAQRYCEIKSRQLYAKISKAIIKGSRWIADEQGKEGKWHYAHTTGNVIATLKLLGYEIEESKSCAKTMTKAAAFLEASNDTIENEHGGRLAYIIMGLKSLCKDPSDYQGKNLLNRLSQDMHNYPKGNFNHPFQYSLALIALAVNDVSVPWQFPKVLVEKVAHILRTRAAHSKDTCSMMAIALAAVYKQFPEKPRFAKKIRVTMLKLAKTLRNKLDLKKDNLYTKSLIMQAQTAVNSVLGDKHQIYWSSRKCENNYADLLSKMGSDGSFGGLSANLHVLPALVGVSYLDLKNDASCITKEKGSKRQVKINVCVKIEFEGIEKANPPSQMVTVLNGSTAFDALREASLEQDGCQMVSQQTSWGESIRSLCGVMVDHKKKLYWMFFIDEKMASTGVGNYYPKKDECIIMKYQKLDFK